MAELANPVRHEFWRPPAQEKVAGQERSETCEECRTEFIVGSRYCHCCGASRPLNSAQQTDIPGLTEFTALGKRLGLATPSLISFLFGAFCLAAAFSVGVIFTARTPLDWQALQLWRIEWLLTGIASFVAGLLLKKAS